MRTEFKFLRTEVLTVPMEKLVTCNAQSCTVGHTKAEKKRRRRTKKMGEGNRRPRI